MSFKCDTCNEAQPVGSQPLMVVTHRRSYVPAPGFQIAKEAVACKPCSIKLEATGPIELEPMENEEFFESKKLADNKHGEAWRSRP